MLKKLFVVAIGEGRQNPRKMLPVYVVGYYKDDKGVVWKCFAPKGITLSVWVRMESPGKRPQFVYDAGGGFKKAYIKKRKPK